MAGLDIPTGRQHQAATVRGHTMSFVYFQAIHTASGVTMFELIGILLGRIPESSIVDGRDVQILSDSLDPGRQTVDSGARRLSHRDFDHRIMRNGADSGRFRRYVTLPNTKG